MYSGTKLNTDTNICNNNILLIINLYFFSCFWITYSFRCLHAEITSFILIQLYLEKDDM